jgi:hypothetical protein
LWIFFVMMITTIVLYYIICVDWFKWIFDYWHQHTPYFILFIGKFIYQLIYNNYIDGTHYTSWIDLTQHARGPCHHSQYLLSTCKLSTSSSTRIMNLCLLPIFCG